MTAAKKLEANQEKQIAKLKDTLAEKEEDLLLKKKELADLELVKKETEEYLLKIKPGCDFIEENLSLRKANRKTEKEALEKAIKLIKGTPVYKTFKSEEKSEDFGKCAGVCEADASSAKFQKEKSYAKENTAECQACLGDVTVPAYCAGHPETPGCGSSRRL